MYRKCGQYQKGEIRVGKMNEEYGKYGIFVCETFQMGLDQILETMKIQRKKSAN